MQQTTCEEEDKLHDTSPTSSSGSLVQVQSSTPPSPGVTDARTQVHALGTCTHARAHTHAPGLSGQLVNSTTLGRINFKK